MAFLNHLKIILILCHLFVIQHSTSTNISGNRRNNTTDKSNDIKPITHWQESYASTNVSETHRRYSNNKSKDIRRWRESNKTNAYEIRDDSREISNDYEPVSADPSTNRPKRQRGDSNEITNDYGAVKRWRESGASADITTNTSERERGSSNDYGAVRRSVRTSTNTSETQRSDSNEISNDYGAVSRESNRDRESSTIDFEQFFLRPKRELSNSSVLNSSIHSDILLDDLNDGMNQTNCSNEYCISDEDYMNMIDEYMFPSSYEWVLIFFHSMVFLIGLVGNALVCVAVYRNHSMRTVTNYFIVNLAVADFMVILFCLPPTVLWDVTETWFMGEAMCKIVLYIQTVSVTVSVLTLTFISIDRWYAICFPLKFKSTTGRAKTAILLIWLFALAFDIPELVVLQTYKRLERVDTHYFIQCEASWSADSDTTWSVLKMILLYALPLGFMSFAYCQIVRVLWQSDNIPGHMINSGSAGVGGHRNDTFTMNSNASTEGQLRSRRKAAKMLVAVVVMFAVCYFPVHLFSVMRLTMQLPQNDMNTALALLSHWMCYANSAVNPVIYNFMSGKFRKEFRATFGCTCCCKEAEQARRQRNITRSSTYVYRFTHGGSTIARTEVLPLSHMHHSHRNHHHQNHHGSTTNNNHGYSLHDSDNFMHTAC